MTTESEAVWHYAKNGQSAGPVSVAQLRAMAAEGTLLPDDLIWKTGFDQWVPARTVKGLGFAAPGNQAAPGAPASAIKIRCSNPNCNGQFRVPADRAGRKLRCPRCKRPIEIAGGSNHSTAAPLSSAGMPVAAAFDAAEPPQLSDAQLAAFLQSRTERGPTPAFGATTARGWFDRAKRRMRALQLKREIAGLEASIQQDLVRVGIQALERAGEGLSIGVERSELQRNVAEIQEREARLTALSGKKSTRSIVRRLQAEIDALSKSRNDVLARVGRKAHQQGLVEAEAATRIASLDALLHERRVELAALGPEFTAAQPDRARSRLLGRIGRWLRTAAVVLLLLGFGFAGYWVVEQFFDDRLRPFAAIIPENADFVVVVDNRLEETPAGQRIAEAMEDRMEAMTILMGPGNWRDMKEFAEIKPKLTILAGSTLHDDVPSINAFSATSPIELPRRLRERYPEREYRGRTIRTQEVPVSATSLYFEDSSRLLVMGNSTGIEKVIDQQVRREPPKAYDRISQWMKRAPRKQHVYAVYTRFPESADVNRARFFARPIASQFGPLGSLADTSLTIANPEELEALIITALFDEDIRVEARLFYHKTADAAHYEELVNESVQKARKDVDDVRNDNLRLHMTKVLGSVQSSREGACLIVGTTIPTRLVIDLLQMGP